jgi:hypothetical protein
VIARFAESPGIASPTLRLNAVDPSITSSQLEKGLAQFLESLKTTD